MNSLNIHFLDAREALSDVREWVHAALTETFIKANTLLALGPLDVVVKPSVDVIPEKGHLGYAPEPGLVFVSVDPGSPLFRANNEDSFERMFAHELHHVARWDGPGYGRSLGEALVSEGLAGFFAREVCGGALEPWERLSLGEVGPYVSRAERHWSSLNYDHPAWFLGHGDLPRWLGYSMGHQLIARFLSRHPGATAAQLADADAQAFRGFLPPQGD
ncbi:DUF2268 domain-containing putative Zn-dependent protease [Stutzerimonas stutzeri]|uniref:DUF2268 domain-containing putative Zn-dependent protease n=1 Tax=Stutzerimonas stutzeri TaxID=316 RepID=UPI001C2E1AF5|nr:DUF2268 domain-containing putative Zn-dependent protease [Stutzerimonas stutzeri]